MADATGVKAANATPARTDTAPRRRRKSVLVLGLCVFAGIGIVVGGLYLALLRVPAAPPRTQQIGSVRATVETDPHVPWKGPAMLAVSMVDTNETPVTDAEVILAYDMQTDSIGRRMAGMGEPARATADMNAPGRYVAPVNFPMAGQWVVRVAIRRGGRSEGEGVFLVTVR